MKLDESITLGPKAFYVNSIDYDVDELHQEEFFKSVNEFLLFVEYNDLASDMSGIRPKLQSKNDSFVDLVIREESDKGIPGLINLIGIESPGLTSSPAIAEYVERLVLNLANYLTLFG